MMKVPSMVVGGCAPACDGLEKSHLPTNQNPQQQNLSLWVRRSFVLGAIDLLSAVEDILCTKTSRLSKLGYTIYFGWYINRINNSHSHKN